MTPSSEWKTIESQDEKIEYDFTKQHLQLLTESHSGVIKVEIGVNPMPDYQWGSIIVNLNDNAVSISHCVSHSRLEVPEISQKQAQVWTFELTPQTFYLWRNSIKVFEYTFFEGGGGCSEVWQDTLLESFYSDRAIRFPRKNTAEQYRTKPSGKVLYIVDMYFASSLSSCTISI